MIGGTGYLARLTADGQGLLAPRELAQQIYDLALLREARCGTERISSRTGEGELGMGELNTARIRPGPHWLHATQTGLTQG